MSNDKVRALAGLMRLNFKTQVRARKQLAETERQQEVIFQVVATELGVSPDQVRYDSVANDWVIGPPTEDPKGE